MFEANNSGSFQKLQMKLCVISHSFATLSLKKDKPSQPLQGNICCFQEIPLSRDHCHSESAVWPCEMTSMK